MSLSPVPGREAFLAIHNFFPVFKSENACIAWVQPDGNPADMWRVHHVVDLPFVHRMEIVPMNSSLFVVAATLCEAKAFMDDWSMSGAVYAGRVPEDPCADWQMETILHGVTKNHGMHATSLGGRDVVLIAGQEGLFAVNIPRRSGEGWTCDRLLEHEISDIYVADVDLDGNPEIVTIEPFHGDRLAVYKYFDKSWRLISEVNISFGHALWAGNILGKSLILVGQRGGSKNLEMLFPVSHNPFKLQSEELDSGVGSAQLSVVSEKDKCLVVSANHAVGEVALYEITSA